MCLLSLGHTNNPGIAEMHVMKLSSTVCYKASFLSSNQLKQILMLQLLKTNRFLECAVLLLIGVTIFMEKAFMIFKSFMGPQ